MPDPEVVRITRALVDDVASAAQILAELDGDPARLAAVAVHAATVAAGLAKIAAQLAAEAVARGVDAGPVQAEAGSAAAVLDLVFRSMGEPATGETGR